MAGKLSTIEWMIKFIGDRGAARRADILDEGRKAGHNTSTLKHYMTSTKWFGHVHHRDCTSSWHNRRGSADRIPYFRRRAKGVYTLNEKYIARYASLVNENQLTRVAIARAYARGEKVITVTPQKLKEDFDGIPVGQRDDGIFLVLTDGYNSKGHHSSPDVLDCHLF